MVAFLKRHWRRLVLGLLLAWALLPLIQLIKPGAARRGEAVIGAAINLILVGSQTFWISRVGIVGGKVVTGRKWRVGLGALGLVIYVVLLAYNLRNWEDLSKGSALSLGVFGCLGNHEWLTKTEESITDLCAAQGTRILRNERAAITTGGSAINVLGVDYQSRRGRTEAPG